jgi:hypothetical protein
MKPVYSKTGIDFVKTRIYFIPLSQLGEHTEENLRKLSLIQYFKLTEFLKEDYKILEEKILNDTLTEEDRLFIQEKVWPFLKKEWEYLEELNDRKN